MATVTQLEQDGLIERLDIEMEIQEQPWRCLYGTPDFIRWLGEELVGLETRVVGGDLEPLEQVDDLFHQFVVGEDFSTDRRFRKLTSSPEHFVWELKTIDIRIFGWIPQKDFFICTFGGLADDIKLFEQYGTNIAKTVYVRNHLDLDEPKYVNSVEYENVISTKNKP